MAFMDISIPEPRASTPMVIGTGYRRNSDAWEPTIAGRPLAWWRTFFSQLDTTGEWYKMLDEGRVAMRRAYRLLKLSEQGLFLHFGIQKGVEAFTLDRYRNYGRHMRKGVFTDWQSGERRKA